MTSPAATDLVGLSIVGEGQNSKWVQDPSTPGCLVHPLVLVDGNDDQHRQQTRAMTNEVHT